MMKKMMKHWKEYGMIGITHAIGGIGVGFLLTAYLGVGGVMWGWILVVIAVVLHLYLYMM